MSTFKTVGAMWVGAMLAMGCGNTAATVGGDSNDSITLDGASEEMGTMSSELSSGVAVGSTLKTTADLNLRSSASLSASIRMVIPFGSTVTTVNRTTPSGVFYNVKFNGVEGWSSGNYLTLVSSGSTSTPTTPTTPTTPSGSLTGTSRESAIARAKTGVGFSYWWGHGRWQASGASANPRGSCTGSCPNCSHSGSYGADCSGFVAKAWQVPSTNDTLSEDSHPYGTGNFVGSGSNWKTVSRSSLTKGDALVYNDGSHGHIFLYESGDGWGSMWAYEAKGCSYGITHNLRTGTSAYKGIKRSTW